MGKVLDFCINVAVGVFTLFVVHNNTKDIITSETSIGNILIASAGILLFNTVKRVLVNGTK